MRKRYHLALPLFRRSYEAAREQRLDNCTANMGFQQVLSTPHWRQLALAGVDVEGGYPRPSELLQVLREADAAGTRCKRLLPTSWVLQLDRLRNLAMQLDAPLRLMVEWQGDSLCAPPGPAGAAIRQCVSAALNRVAEVVFPAYQALPIVEACECSGCGSWNPALRKCFGCKQAQYCRCARCRRALASPLLHLSQPAPPPTPPVCSRKCQKKHWPEHKAACKAAQCS